MGKVNYDISRQMQIDLIEAYKAVAPHCWTQREAYERMVKQPAPRYYVTAKQAYQVIAPMVKGDFEMVNMMLPRKREMYLSLFSVVEKMLDQRAFIGKSLYYVMQYAVGQPAPEFFIGPSRAKQIRIWLRKGVIDDSGKVDDSKLLCYATSRESKRKKREERKKWMSERM